MTTPLRASLSVFLLIFAIIAAGNLSWGQEVSPLSVTSLALKIFRNDTEIGSATGFVLEKNKKYYLVTNRHVVLACGQDPNPENIGGWICANKLAIFHNRSGTVGFWLWVNEDLLDKKGNPRWFEHPTLKGKADLIALPLTQTENVQFYPLDLELKNKDIAVYPGDSVSIVGFPLGIAQVQASGLPIWKTGTVASDPAIDFNGRPMFAVDTTSRGGMSGSPVYATRTGAYHTSKGEPRVVLQGVESRFLGVYSEQNVIVEIGGVWKADVVAALYDSLP